MKRSKNEHNLQVLIVQYLRLNNFLVFSTPNGGSRNLLEAVNLKKEGLLAGAPDLVLVLKNKVLFLELKTETGRQSIEQKEFEQKVKNLNHKYYIIRSLDDLINILKEAK